MISNETIERTLEAAEREGFTIEVADISNAILARHYEDRGNIVEDAAAYFATPALKWLDKYLSEVVFNDADITFEENKKSMLELIERTRQKERLGEIDPDKAISLEKEIRKIINDKFNVQDDTKDKVVCVETKYNMICRHGYECYLPTKEDLMKMYGLVEKEKK